MPLSAPQQSGDILKPADIQNHILVVIPTEFIPHIQNVNTKPGEQSPAIRVNIADFSVTDDAGQPTIYAGALWFNQMLHSNLKRQVGESILGMMAVGAATPGRNAPFYLAEVTDPAWLAHCSNWLDNTPEGQAFETQGVVDTNRGASAAEVAQVARLDTATPPPAPASAPPAPAPIASAPPAPAGPPALPTAPVLAPSTPTPPAAALPAGLEALIANMPADQQAAARALMAQQQAAAS